MDSSARQREVVKAVLNKYSALRPSHGDIRVDPILDPANDRYALVQVGWDRGRRVKGLLLYIVLQDGKICVEYDGFENGIVEELIALGIPEQEIVLGFLTEVAV